MLAVVSLLVLSGVRPLRLRARQALFLTGQVIFFLIFVCQVPACQENLANWIDPALDDGRAPEILSVSPAEGERFRDEGEVRVVVSDSQDTFLTLKIDGLIVCQTSFRVPEVSGFVVRFPVEYSVDGEYVGGIFPASGVRRFSATVTDKGGRETTVDWTLQVEYPGEEEALEIIEETRGGVQGDPGWSDTKKSLLIAYLDYASAVVRAGRIFPDQMRSRVSALREAVAAWDGFLAGTLVAIFSDREDWLSQLEEEERILSEYISARREYAKSLDFGIRPGSSTLPWSALWEDIARGYIRWPPAWPRPPIWVRPAIGVTSAGALVIGDYLMGDPPCYTTRQRLGCYFMAAGLMGAGVFSMTGGGVVGWIVGGASIYRGIRRLLVCLSLLAC